LFSAAETRLSIRHTSPDVAHRLMPYFEKVEHLSLYCWHSILVFDFVFIIFSNLFFKFFFHCMVGICCFFHHIFNFVSQILFSLFDVVFAMFSNLFFKSFFSKTKGKVLPPSLQSLVLISAAPMHSLEKLPRTLHELHVRNNCFAEIVIICC
jgi:hypothetical protein